MVYSIRQRYHHLWRENRISLVMGNLFVFDASSQDTSLKTATPKNVSMEQDQLDNPQVITNIQHSSIPFYRIDDL